MVPHIASLLHVDRLTRSADDKDTFHRRRSLERLVRDLFQRHHFPALVRAVACNQNFGLAVINPFRQRLHGKTSVDHGMNGADACARKHGDRQFRYASHVDRDAVPLLHAETPEDIGKSAHFAAERKIRERAKLPFLPFPHQCQFVPTGGGRMAVEAIVRDVGLPADEPLVERLLRFIQHLFPMLEPMKLVRLFRPEAFQIFLGRGGHRSPISRVRMPNDLFGGVEHVACQLALSHTDPPDVRRLCAESRFAPGPALRGDGILKRGGRESSGKRVRETRRKATGRGALIGSLLIPASP